MNFHGRTLFVFYLLFSWTSNCFCGNTTKDEVPGSALEKLVKLFSTPGAFERVEEIFGENSIEESSMSCPKGDEGLDCRRAEARRSIDCPNGDCYCYSCADAGPELWPSCCRESSKCCSHLAAACRNCDHLILIPFCSKHFKKCSEQITENATSINHTPSSQHS